MIRRWMAAVAATLVLSLFAAGCGGNKIEKPEKEAPPPAGDSAVEAPPIPPMK